MRSRPPTSGVVSSVHTPLHYATPLHFTSLKLHSVKNSIRVEWLNCQLTREATMPSSHAKILHASNGYANVFNVRSIYLSIVQPATVQCNGMQFVYSTIWRDFHPSSHFACNNLTMNELPTFVVVLIFTLRAVRRSHFVMPARIKDIVGAKKINFRMPKINEKFIFILVVVFFCCCPRQFSFP